MDQRVYLLIFAMEVCVISAKETEPKTFPPNFLFGASTSAYQIEGAWNVDGKGESIWDRFTHTNRKGFAAEENGDVACNSYYLYEEDIDILKKMKFQVYRFSISWARILPNGDLSNINQAGIAYYNNLINALVKNKIEPMVTMYHWDLPQKLQDEGGWLNSSIIQHMENYADLLFSIYGDRVKWWITLNEPTFIISGYAAHYFAPGLCLTSPNDYIIAHNLLRTHGRVYRLYEKKYRAQQNGKISISLHYDFCRPKNISSIDDIKATERHFQFQVGIFAHPIYSKEGGYPPLVEQTVNQKSKEEGLNKSKLLLFTREERMELRGSSDFFALNHYSTNLCSNSLSKSQGALPFVQDMDVQLTHDPSWPSSSVTELSNWFRVVPWGFKSALLRISDEYNRPDIIVTENGYPDIDNLDDLERINYHQEYLTEMLDAMQNHNCTILGYCVWSLIDNFEWISRPYSRKFGIFKVDFPFNSTERKRTPKASSVFFASLMESRKIPSKKFMNPK